MTSATARGYATHILTENADLDIPGYRIEREFGPLRVWRLEAEDARIRDWVEHRPNVAGSMYPVMRVIDPYSPTPPVLFGLRFAD